MTGANFDLKKIDCLAIDKAVFELYFKVAILEVGVPFLPMALRFVL